MNGQVLKLVREHKYYTSRWAVRLIPVSVFLATTYDNNVTHMNRRNETHANKHLRPIERKLNTFVKKGIVTVDELNQLKGI